MSNESNLNDESATRTENKDTAKNNFFSKTKSILQQATNSVQATNVSVNVNSLQDSLRSITGGLIRPKFHLPDRAVASQVLMYRQLLHTECKPGLRLSREYQGTDAQKKVMHMPWWEQGVESTRKMVISYDNLIVRLWLAGAIMPFVDGGYAEAHSNVTMLKDDTTTSDDSNSSKGLLEIEIDDNDSHIDTLIDSNGLPPIPHHYWVDRLGFQQTDPVTDFRSGGVLSLAMLCHIVEACPNVHARFLPSGDTHMLPFGITCINITDMIAKSCMFSKSVDKMDVLVSQKPFWKMFENPDSLLVLQELSMEILCNVVVELKRERKLENTEEKNVDEKIISVGQISPKEVTVFDFSEILKRTEKRVNEDLLGSGPRTVDELRAIHTKNQTRYLKAIDQKEKYHERKISQKQHMPTKLPGASPETTFAVFSAATEPMKALSEPVKSMTDNMIGSTTGMLQKIKGFGSRPSHSEKNDSTKEQATIEVVDFSNDDFEDYATINASDYSAGTKNESALSDAQSILNFLDEDDISNEAERAKQQFENLLNDSVDSTSPVDLFTIDDDDFLM